MKDLENLFVPCNIALLAKEQGFNKQCFGLYNKETTLHCDRLTLRTFNVITNKLLDILKSDACAAPIYQQLVDWFREKHEIYILPFIQFENKGVYDEELKESLDNIYFIFNLKELRKNNQNVLPYIEVIEPTFTHSDSDWYGNINQAFEEAFKLI